MPVPPILTDPFAPEYRRMVQEFNDLVVYTPDDLLAIWSRNSDLLNAARGVFVVGEAVFEKPSLPGNRNFGQTGFLQNWMADTRLVLIQDYRGDREFRYSPHIFCDTNFVSFCGAFHSGRDLGGNTQGFAEAVEFLAPISGALTALPFLVENAERRTREQLRKSLVAFAAFKSDPDRFRNKANSGGISEKDPEEIADSTLKMMDGPDFKLLHSWAKDQYRWAKVVLTKAALLGFDKLLNTTEQRLYGLLSFLHTDLARIPAFETYVACRFFALNVAEPFFNPVQLNAKSLHDSLRSMAWDLAHWRLSFDMLMISSHRTSETPFPIPHFLSFDRRFVRLTERFRLRGLIYNAGRRRSECIYSRTLLEEVSDLLSKRCYAEFYSATALRDRRERATAEDVLDRRLVELEDGLEGQLAEALTQAKAI